MIKPIDKFIDCFKISLEKNTFVKAQLSKYRGREQGLEKILINLVQLKDGLKLSFKYRFATKDLVKNFSIEEGLGLIREALEHNFKAGNVYTTQADYQLVRNKKGHRRVIEHLPSNTSLPSLNHDKQKQRTISQKQSFLFHLGITTKEGKVKSDKNDKFRQINKFIEIVEAVYKKSDAYLKQQLKIVDMGSGKSYLTFALYDYFVNQQNIQTKITGVEQRKELVDFSNELAEQCGFKKLGFVEGSIQEARVQGADIVVALHACDTATDDALFKALESKVEIIIVAPCCQHYVRKIMETPETLQAITKNGIHKERLAVTLTDSLRALTLEAFGYKTKVMEFIDAEHTAKNVMITAVLDKNAKFNEKRLQEIHELKIAFGIKDYYLDTLLFE